MAKKVKIELDFEHGQEVYLKTDPEQFPRMITDIRLIPGGIAMYSLSFADTESEHYAFEISDARDLIKPTGD